MPPTKPNRRPIAVDAMAMLLHWVANPTRAHILLVLGDGERHGDVLSGELGCSMPALSDHLRRLRLVGLVEFRWDGRRDVCSLTDKGHAVRAAIETLSS